MSELPKTIEKGSSLWADAMVRLRKNKLAVFGAIFVVFILVVCFLGAPVLSWMGMDANEQNLTSRFAPFGATTEQVDQETGEVEKTMHPLGTDQLGRDMLMRALEGGQISLLVALLATVLTVTVGVIYGGIAGYIGGRIENIMMRVVDGLLAMPFLIIVILFRELISAKVDELARWLIDDFGFDADLILRFSNLAPLVLAITAFGWLTMGRIVRTAAASLAKQEFVEAARSLGLSHVRILFRHILPNMLGPIIIYATLTIPSFILTEATLSFIGLGVEPPNSSWGILIKEGANYLETEPVILAIPAILFSLTLFAFNFLGDGLRDALDPKAAKD